jgi:filamentous hemagglutinin family protein
MADMSCRLRHLLLMSTALLPLWPMPAGTNPLGPSVQGGSSTVQGVGTSTVTVNQQTDRAIINWQSFNIGTGETTRFIQPSSTSVGLNRVVGGEGASNIQGTLTANGRIFLINPDGILFGPNSVINTAGFLATTSDIKNADFMAGNYKFDTPGKPGASIVNHGNITAADGGFAALVAPGVRNTGTITATMGVVTLAAGNLYTLDLYGDKLIKLAVGDEVAGAVTDVSTGLPLQALVKNEATGVLKAHGGRVELTAAAARQVVNSVINTSGVVEANSVGVKNGAIVLSAATAATKPTGAPAQTVKVSGTLAARGAKDTGTRGGKVQVTGEHIELSAAKIDVSGDIGGGKVLIGGDVSGGSKRPDLTNIPQAAREAEALPTATTVTANATTQIDASAITNGDGGKVVLWSDQTTIFDGSILATGGLQGGRGGFVEVGGGQFLSFTGTVDLRGAQGLWGNLLLESGDLTIKEPDDEVPGNGRSFLSSITLQAALAGANVIVAATGATGSGHVEVTSSFDWNAPSNLTLSAYNRVKVHHGVVITHTGDAGDLVLRADNTGTGTGTVDFLGGPYSEYAGRVDFSGSSGKVSIFYNPEQNDGNKYNNPMNYGANVSTGIPGALTAYMLINSESDLQDLGTSAVLEGAIPTIRGAFALGRDFAVGEPFAPGVTFSGLLDGQGFAIDGLKIAGAGSTVGLFGVNDGIIRGLNLTNVDITATGNSQYVGAIAGVNHGDIVNSSVSGVVNGGTGTGIVAGGLAGLNSGVIRNAWSSANVSVGNSQSCATCSGSNFAGGLVGVNNATGRIRNSMAGGNVSGGVLTTVGGLVGLNDGRIARSTVTGSHVQVAGGTSNATDGSAGGLAGRNNGRIRNSRADDVVVTGGDWTAVAGLVGNNGGDDNLDAVIARSFATGAVTGGYGSLVGGLAGTNDGRIRRSGANVTVQGGSNSIVGGLVGGMGIDGVIRHSIAAGTASAGPSSMVGGLVGGSFGEITESAAAVAVTTGDGGFAGGLVGAQFAGRIEASASAGAVTAGNDSFAGGLVGANFASLVSQSSATGAVRSGDRSMVGGLVGMNAGGFITQAFASGVVVGGNGSRVGGFAGANLGLTGIGETTIILPGLVTAAYATGTVTGGAGSQVGGFVGENGGLMTQTMAVGRVSGGAGSTLGGLIAVNATGSSTTALPGLPAALNDCDASCLALTSVQISTSPGLVTASYWDTQSTGQATSAGTSGVPGIAGATGLPTAQLAGVLPAGFDTAFWQVSQTPLSYPFLSNPLPVTLPLPGDLPTPPVITDPLGTLEKLVATQAQLTNQVVLAALQNPGTVPSTPDPVVTQGSDSTGSTGSGNGGSGNRGNGAGRGNGVGAPPPRIGDRNFTGVPPLGETRFINDQLVLQFGANISQQQIEAIARRFGLTVMTSQDFGLVGSKIIQFKIGNGRSVRDVILALEAAKLGVVAQPNYVFTLAEDDAELTGSNRAGDPDQYIVDKLRLSATHRIATGASVLVAVIDSAIDARHPDLAGVIADRFEESEDTKPHPHGTGMTSALASHHRLVGVAPGARVLAVNAFSGKTASASGTTFQILAGLDWAIRKGARVVNMSFAGPRDPSLEQALKFAHDKGIVLVAAAGNAGPKSPPLFPGADPNVIAVTATDADNKLFSNANRGKYVGVAAPGVDILVAAPNGSYQITTGTSVATAHVSGVAALLLERQPSLDPEAIRRILTTTAVDLGPPGRDDGFGAGLIDPIKALRTLDRAPLDAVSTN